MLVKRDRIICPKTIDLDKVNIEGAFGKIGAIVQARNVLDSTLKICCRDPSMPLIRPPRLNIASSRSR
jgi:hypothetical protein